MGLTMVVRTQHIALIIAAACIAALSYASGAPRAADVTALPNGWRVTPAGTILPLGTLPLRAVQDAYGKWLAISNAGYGDLSVSIVGQEDGTIADSAPIAHTFYGLAFSPTEDALYASTASDGGIAQFPFDSSTGRLGKPTFLTLGSGKLWVNGLAVSLDGSIVYAAVAGANDLVAVRPRSGATVFATHVDDTPYAVMLSNNGSRVYVSNWGSSSVSVIDSRTGALLDTIDTDDHPGAMLFGADGRTLYIACANSNVVDVVDSLTG